MRTQGRQDCDLPYVDGNIIFEASDMLVTGGTATATRVAKGELSWRFGANQVGVLMIPLGSVLFRSGLQDDLQQQFGSGAASGAQGLAAPPASFTTPASVSGRPPFTGATQFVPPTSRPKGVLIKSVTLRYAISGAALTQNNFGIAKTVWANNAAPVVTDLLANGQNGLALATQAQPYVTTIALPTNSQVFLTTIEQTIMMEWDPTTQGAGQLDVFGIRLAVTYNFN